MSERKSLFRHLQEAYARYRAEQRATPDASTPSRLRRILGWFIPNGGTVLLVLVLILTQRVWARPATTAASAPGPGATTVNYQGRLADALGNPLTGSYGMTFALWDDPISGTLAWGPEVYDAVPVNEGLFNVGLGSRTAGGIPTSVWSGDRYLEVTVAGEALSPRELLRGVPIAGMALTVPKVNIVRQDDTTNSAADRVILTGWGYIQGDNTSGLTEPVSFGTTFAEPPVVLVSFLGGTDVQPSAIGDFEGIDVESQKVWSVVSANITTAGFDLQISRNVGTFPADWYYGYSWIAIGTAP
jgi:hypothetical protein